MIDNENVLNEAGLSLYDSLIKNWFKTRLDAEISARTETDEVILQQLSALSETLRNEISARTENDEEMLQQLSALSEALENEIETLNTEIENRISGETYIINLLEEYQEVTQAQIDALFYGHAHRVQIVVDEEYAEYVSVSAVPELAEDGDSVTLTAVMAQDPGEYEFDGWYVNGTKVSSNLTYQVTFNHEDTYEVKLASIAPVYYTLTFVTNGDGEVYVNEPGVTSITVAEGGSVTFTPYATPDSGYNFDGWSDGLTNGQPNTVTNVRADKTYTATFSQIVYHTLTFVSNGNGSVYVNEPGVTTIMVEDGDSVQFTPYATPDSGYKFVSWSDGLTNEQPNRVDNVTQDKTYTATFSQVVYNTVTYTFTSRAWSAVTDEGIRENWISNKEGNQMNSTQGVQITTGTSLASATSPRNFQNIQNVTFIYSTNSSKGTGSIKIQIPEGSGVGDLPVTKEGGQTDRALSFDCNGESGNIRFTVTCTQNSIYVKSVSITYEVVDQMIE